MTLPEKFAARVLSELGPEEGAALCAALDTEPPVSVRLNPAKCAGAAEPGAVQDGTGAAPGGYQALNQSVNHPNWIMLCNTLVNSWRKKHCLVGIVRTKMYLCHSIKCYA